jgi:hypothetical protein
VNPIDWVAIVVGSAIVIGTTVSVVKTMVVPRRSWSLLPSLVARGTTALYMFVARRMRSFDVIDRFLGFLAPSIVIGNVLVWLLAYLVGFGLILAPWTPGFAESLRESGSSLFTLGFVSTDTPIPATIDIIAGATGLIVVALTIAYLPTLYAILRDRERLTKQLEARAGSPPWGPHILAGHHEEDALEILPEFFAAWDLWSAGVAETHTKYPALAQFRLPRAGCHWLTSLLAVLDAAALDLSLRPSTPDPAARMLLRVGDVCMADLAHMARVEDAVDREAPMLDFEEFAAAVTTLSDDGYPVEVTAEEAWPVFRDLRSTYASTAYVIADVVVAPPGPWSGERSLPARNRPSDVS